jgi:hypothetical protein
MMMHGTMNVKIINLVLRKKVLDTAVLLLEVDGK